MRRVLGSLHIHEENYRFKEWRVGRKSVLLVQGKKAEAQIAALRTMLEQEHLCVVVRHTGCAVIRELIDRVLRTFDQPQFTVVIIDWNFADGSYHNGVMLLDALREYSALDGIHIIMTDRRASEAKRNALLYYRLLGYHRPSRGPIFESIGRALRR